MVAEAWLCSEESQETGQAGEAAWKSLFDHLVIEYDSQRLLVIAVDFVTDTLVQHSPATRLTALVGPDV